MSYSFKGFEGKYKPRPKRILSGGGGPKGKVSWGQLKDTVNKKTKELEKYLLSPVGKNEKVDGGSFKRILSVVDSVRESKKLYDKKPQSSEQNGGFFGGVTGVYRKSKLDPKGKTKFKSKVPKNMGGHKIKGNEGDDLLEKKRINVMNNVGDGPLPLNANGEEKGVRIAKMVAQCSDLSHREAEKYVLKGRIRVDGRVETNFAYRVLPNERVTMDGHVLSRKRPELFVFNKMKKVLITREFKDKKNRLTLGSILKDINRLDLSPVGRLDYMTEGLLLLTNSGELKNRLEHPSSKIKRCYRVRVYGKVNMDQLEELKEGITIDGIVYGPIIVEMDSKLSKRKSNFKRLENQANIPKSGCVVDSDRAANTWLSVTIYEGKNREIKKIFNHFNLKISRLVRVAYGPYSLDGVPLGVIKYVEIKSHLKRLISKSAL